ncbi:MAG: methionyl-tRNA formyltransferase, partial [Actinomycetes bacterium]
SLDFDIAVVVAFGQIIPSELLAKPKYGWINLHYSLLPNLRGAAPVQWAILNNESETGITWFQIDKGLDTGPILLQKKIKLNNQTHDELIAELNNLATEKLDNFLDDIEYERVQKKDQSGEISYAPKLTDKDLKIDWNQNLDKIKSVIRTGNDYLSAWTQMNGDKIKILNYRNSDSEKLPPGNIQLSSKSVHVGTNSVSLVLDEVIPQGKKRMPALDWFNGIQSKENLKFE